MLENKKSLIITVTLMVTIIIDVMGMGLVFPIYPDLFFNEKYAIINLAISENMHNFLYGIGLCAWPIGLFVGSPYFGDLSDKISRKTVIVICLFGTFLTYVSAAYAVDHKLFLLFILSRFFSGLFGGSFPIAQAMMIDISSEETKAKNLSLITLAASFGFVVGPLITSVATMKGVADWMTITSPFYIAGIFSLLNMLSVWCFLPKMAASNPDAKLHLLKSLGVIVEVLVDKRTRKMLCAFFLMFVGWGFYVSILSLLLYKVFHYSSSQVALMYSLLAISNVVATFTLRPLLFRYLSLEKICLITGVVAAGLISLAMWTSVVAIQWFVAAVAPGFQLMFYIAIMTMFSNAVTEVEQGKVMGGADAAASLAWVVNSFMIGVLLDKSILLPLLFGAASILLGSLVFISRRTAK